MYHRFSIIMESDVISSRESSNTLKPVWIGLDEVFTGVESGEVRSHLTLACSVVGFLVGQGESHLLVSLTAQFSWTIPSFDEEGRPSIGGPGLSATYHLVWRHFEYWWPLGVHSMPLSKAPNVKCLIHCMLSVWCHRDEVQLACHLQWYV